VSLVLGGLWPDREDWIISTDLMCHASALLIQFSIFPTKGRKTTELGSSSWSKCRWRLRALWICRLL
jgi:hypothetical protein